LKRFRVGVPVVDVVTDLLDQDRDGRERPAPDGPAAYFVRLRGRPLALTYKEFELLNYVAQHAGQVFSRAQLLQEVWGYDFFGGPRTVDIHVRRLRAKLGAEHEQMIGTVRNVGYKFLRPNRDTEEMTPRPRNR
jgi:DNA-binding winged helix-turn-helix (wHTH) protein